MFRFSSFKELIEDKPVILIHNGKIDMGHLHREKITMDELEEAVREHGIDSYKNVKLAILEVDGNISVISGEENNLKQTRYKYRRKQKTLTRAS